MVYTLGLVGLEGEVGVRRAKAPDLHCAVQTCGRECVGVFRIDGETHHVMAVALEYLNTFPTFFPVPELNCHVIGSGQDERLGGMNSNRSNVIGMSLEGRDLFGGIIVVDTELEVIRTANNPVLAGNETTGSHGDISELEGFNNGLVNETVSRA